MAISSSGRGRISCQLPSILGILSVGACTGLAQAVTFGVIATMVSGSIEIQPRWKGRELDVREKGFGKAF